MPTHKPFCKLHPDVEPVCPSCRAAKGGAATAGVTSKAKAKSSARNGRLGGRPKLAPHSAGMHGKDDPRFQDIVDGCLGCQERN